MAAFVEGRRLSPGDGECGTNRPEEHVVNLMAAHQNEQKVFHGGLCQFYLINRRGMISWGFSGNGLRLFIKIIEHHTFKSPTLAIRRRSRVDKDYLLVDDYQLDKYFERLFMNRK